MSKPLLFKSTQSGAPVLTGEVGKMIEVLSASLIVNKAFAAVSGASFLDHTAEARLAGGTPFTMFQTPGTSDEFYIGMTVPFDRATFDLATLGVGGTYVWEYWNGASWATLSVTDGTVGFTQDGKVTWTAPGDWATNAVNSVTQFWVRVRLTVANSTNPTVNFCTVTGWVEVFTGTNKRAYQSTEGNQLLFRVQDDAPGAGLAKEGRFMGFESMSDVDTGAGQFPASGQGVGGGGFQVFRKSITADATARAWTVWADPRTVYIFVLSGDSSPTKLSWGFGEFFSLAPGDSFRSFVHGRTAENSASASASGGFGQNWQITLANTVAGLYIARTHVGTGGSILVGRHIDIVKNNNAGTLLGTIVFPNTPDGAIYVTPCWIHETTGPVLRGRFRGLLGPLHPLAALADGDTFQGSGAHAGISLEIVSSLEVSSHAALVLSDNVETN